MAVEHVTSDEKQKWEGLQLLEGAELTEGSDDEKPKMAKESDVEGTNETTKRSNVLKRPRKATAKKGWASKLPFLQELIRDKGYIKMLIKSAALINKQDIIAAKMEQGGNSGRAGWWGLGKCFGTVEIIAKSCDKTRASPLLLAHSRCENGGGSSGSTSWGLLLPAGPDERNTVDRPAPGRYVTDGLIIIIANLKISTK